jgi:hypothetical protein
MSEYKPLYILTLLHIIHYQLPSDRLLKFGLEYSQIANLLLQVEGDGLVINSEKGLVLTDAGLKMLKELKNKLNPSHYPGWIIPSEEYRVPKKDKFDIYLPRKKEPEE